MDSHVHIRAVLVLVTLLSAIIAFLGCSREPVETPAYRLERIVSTLTPTLGLVRPLLPDSVESSVIIGPGEAVHGYRPTARTLVSLRQADVVIGVGVGIDTALLDPVIQHPAEGQLVIVFADCVSIDASGHEGHDHDHHDHAHDEFNPHLWLDIDLVEEFVTSTASQLADRAVSNGNSALAGDILSRSLVWLERIRSIDELYREQLFPFRGMAILTPHPAFGGLLGRYGITEYSFSSTSPHALPSPSQLAEAITRVNEQHVAAIFIEPQSSGTLARAVAERAGLPLGTLDPLGSGDWEEMMTKNLDELVRAFSVERGNAGADIPGTTPSGADLNPSP